MKKPLSSPARRPDYIEPIKELRVADFKTVVFKIDPEDSNGDKRRYEEFMKSLYPYDPKSNIEVMGEPNKSWFKDTLIIFIEYVEMEEVEIEREW